MFYAALQDTPAPLELQKAGPSCEFGLKRIYGKPTSPDKAVKYGTPTLQLRDPGLEYLKIDPLVDPFAQRAALPGD